MKYSFPQDIFCAIEKGELAPPQGLQFLREMDRMPVTSTKVSTKLQPTKQRLEAIFHELNTLIGLAEVKAVMREIHAFVTIQQRRQQEQLRTQPLVLHMIFKGNPGTGKTTVARIMGKFFCEIGILSRGHLIEVERADLVGEYIGHTALKTRDQLKKAYGGILFIDEAYSLARGGEKDFGKESIDVLVSTRVQRPKAWILPWKRKITLPYY